VPKDEDDFTMREIAKEAGISAASVCRILEGHQRTPSEVL
jgi:hypothetical protein